MQERSIHEPIMGDSRPASPRRRFRKGRLELLLLLAAAAALAVIGWYRFSPRRDAGLQVIEGPATTAPAPSVAASSAFKYPVPPMPEAAAAALPAVDESDPLLARMLRESFGEQVVSALRTSGLVRRVVATLDNLGRAHASSVIWPVRPMAGKFTVAETSGQTVIDGDNDRRYAAFVHMVESLDAPRLVQVYLATYPLFQKAYEELGYPRQNFNDRVVEIIDHLLAAPEPSAPVAVRLVKVQGTTPLTRPWLHYVYADSELESLSAGQKIMVRVGPSNERRLKAQLRNIRAALIGR